MLASTKSGWLSAAATRRRRYGRRDERRDRRYAVSGVGAAHTVRGAPVINQANRWLDLLLRGVSLDASAVVVTLSDGTNKLIASATVARTRGGAAQVWSVAFPHAAVAVLTDGELLAAASFALRDGGTTFGETLRILKRTIAPKAPTAAPHAGTYATPLTVRLRHADPTAVVHYTTDDSIPTAASPRSSGPIGVTTSQRIKAIAVDDAGNTSPVAAFGYALALQLSAAEAAA